MKISIFLNGSLVTRDTAPDETLFRFVREAGCFSVKCGCETSNCGLCTVLLDDRPVLSCSLLAVRADHRRVTTLEGLPAEAELLGGFLADQGAEQCGFCNPGFLMNTIAMLRECPDPSEEDIREYLSGNLCRCSGYEGQMRAIMKYLEYRKGGRHGNEGR